MTNQENQTYEISDNLLALLDEEHPDRLPVYEPSAYELGKMIGAREVIDKIKLLVSTGNSEDLADV